MKTVFKIEGSYWNPQRTEPYVRVRLFVGPDEEHLALAGNLTLSLVEYEAFRSTMTQGVLNPANRPTSFSGQAPERDEVKIIFRHRTPALGETEAKP